MKAAHIFNVIRIYSSGENCYVAYINFICDLQVMSILWAEFAKCILVCHHFHPQTKNGPMTALLLMVNQAFLHMERFLSYKMWILRFFAPYFWEYT